jgi:hypothetical protein
MIKNHIHHISKLEFLLAFKAAFNSAIKLSNIQGSFRGIGLIPFNPDAVLSKLDIRFTTPPPSSIESAAWVSKTPNTAAEINK